jgi:hypothetical protein
LIPLNFRDPEPDVAADSKRPQPRPILKCAACGRRIYPAEVQPPDAANQGDADEKRKR